MKQKKQKSKNKNNQSSQSKSIDKTLSRRDFFTKVQYGALAAAVIGAGGWFIAEEAEAMAQEGDLSRIGNGIPTIVQIHDPQCPKCVALQRETRNALENFNDGQFQYLVANIKTSTGQALATTHGVGHVTLLIFDGAGRRQEILSGPNQSSNLTNIFQQHLDKFNAG